MLRNTKANFLRCIDYLRFTKDRIKLCSLQTLALAPQQNFLQKLLTSCLIAVKSHVTRYNETVSARSRKYVYVYNESLEVLSKLKSRGSLATSVFRYEFLNLYTTLPYNLIEELLDLIERILKKKSKKEGKLYLACNDKNAS